MKFIPAFLTIAIAAGISTPLSAAQAYDAWDALRADFPVDGAVGNDAAITGDIADAAPVLASISDRTTSALPEPHSDDQDWSVLALPADTLSVAPATISTRRPPRASRAAADAWARQRHDNGVTAVTVKQSLATFWNARVGADMSLATAPVMSTSDRLLRRFGTEQSLSESGGSAWVQMTAPGSNAIWDRADIEARLDPAQNQNRWGTSFVKAVPLGSEDYALTLRSNFNMVTPVSLGATALVSNQTARLNLLDSGISFMIGQTHSTMDDSWRRHIGAEKKIFGNVKISGEISETHDGGTAKSVFARYSHKW